MVLTAYCSVMGRAPRCCHLLLLVHRAGLLTWCARAAGEFSEADVSKQLEAKLAESRSNAAAAQDEARKLDALNKAALSEHSYLKNDLNDANKRLQKVGSSPRDAAPAAWCRSGCVRGSLRPRRSLFPPAAAAPKRPQQARSDSPSTRGAFSCPLRTRHEVMWVHCQRAGGRLIQHDRSHVCTVQDDEVDEDVIRLEAFKSEVAKRKDDVKALQAQLPPLQKAQAGACGWLLRDGPLMHCCAASTRS